MKPRTLCPHCGNEVLAVPTGDGNILGLCGHVWKEGKVS